LPQNQDDQPPAAKTKHAAAYWFKQLDAADKREEAWRKQGSEIQCRFLDDRKGYKDGDIYERRINILWSNTELQKGSLFANLGNPDVRRAFPKPGRDNKIARTCGLVIERALTACNNRYDPEVQIEDAIEDHLLPGRGICWLEYEATVEAYDEPELAPKVSKPPLVPKGAEQPSPEVSPPPAPPSERIAYQDARFVHVEFKDFRHGSAKRWEDVPWVSREILFTKEDVKRRWPDSADKVKCDYIVEDERTENRGDKDQDFRRAKVKEIWYKPKKIRVYVAEGCDEELSRDEDPYRLEGFFPCPKPLYAVKTASSLMPKSEFLQYKDQADELDRVNTRIWRLLEKLRYCGVYDASGEDGDALEDIGNLEDGQFKPYKNFRALAEGGGLAAAFQVRDLAPIAAAIQSLAQRALELIQAIYEVTGLSDVMRGATDPGETLGAQDLKARFGSQRMQKKQKDVQRFVRSLYKMKAEIIAEHFEREQLEEMTGIRLPRAADRDEAKALLKASEQAKAAAQQMQQQASQPQPGMPNAQPMAGIAQPQPPTDPLADVEPDIIQELTEIADACSWEEVSAVLRSDDRRNYKIDVETDATDYQETEEEKKQRIEFVTMMQGLIASAMQAGMSNPGVWQLAKEMTMFAARAFKIGRTLEETIDDTFEQMRKTPPQPPASDPLAEMRAADLKAQIENKQASNALDQQAKQQDLAAKKALNDMNQELAAQKHQTAMLLEEIERQKAQNALAALQLEASDPHIRARELALKEKEADWRHDLEVQDQRTKEAEARAKITSLNRADKNQGGPAEDSSADEFAAA
jgi:hypothetical protein